LLAVGASLARGGIAAIELDDNVANSQVPLNNPNKSLKSAIEPLNHGKIPLWLSSQRIERRFLARIQFS
jgi:hypothetical protein